MNAFLLERRGQGSRGWLIRAIVCQSYHYYELIFKEVLGISMIKIKSVKFQTTISLSKVQYLILVVSI